MITIALRAILYLGRLVYPLLTLGEDIILQSKFVTGTGMLATLIINRLDQYCGLAIL